MLEAAGCPCGRLGTLGYRFRDLDFGGERTTPEASDLFRVLRRDARRRRHGGGDGGLVARAGAGTASRAPSFDARGVPNLTRDHFDFHRDFEDYFAAKAALFEQLKHGRAGGGERRRSLRARACAESSVRARSRSARRGEVRGARGACSTRPASRGEIVDAARRAAVRLAAARTLQPAQPARRGGDRRGARACRTRRSPAGSPRTQPLPGRMEPVERGQEFPVIVDYAHTDAALARVLRARSRELAGAQGGGGLRLRRRSRSGQAPADGTGRRRARGPADPHLRQSAQRGSARDPVARSRRGSKARRAALGIASCPTAARRSGAAIAVRGAAARRVGVLVAGKGHESGTDPRPTGALHVLGPRGDRGGVGGAAWFVGRWMRRPR